MDFPFKSLGPALHGLALVLLLALAAAVVSAAVLLAMLPGRIAVRRGHPQADSVNILGWLGLPTGVLWVAAMAWAHWRPTAGAVAETASFDVGVQTLGTQIDKLETAVAALEQQRKAGTR